MMRTKSLIVILVLILLSGCQDKPEPIAVGTTLVDSGLIEELLLAYDQELTVIPLGTGDAIRAGEAGDIAGMFIHDIAREKAFVKQHPDAYRYDIMYNYFVFVGPKDYQYRFKVSQLNQFQDLLLQEDYLFVSRGDSSGTHAKELDQWVKRPTNYLETGQGAAATLEIAHELEGITFIDKGTFLKLSSQYEDYVILYEGKEEVLRNEYGFVVIKPSSIAADFAQWLLSDEARSIISQYGKSAYQNSLFQPVEVNE